MYVNCLGGPNFLVVIYVPEGFSSHRSMIGRVFLQPDPKAGMDFVIRTLGESECVNLLDYSCVAELGGL